MTKEQIAQIITYIVNNKIGIYKAYGEDIDLEQLYLRMTKKPDASYTG
jgi:hypothetical protein